MRFLSIIHEVIVRIMLANRTVENTVMKQGKSISKQAGSTAGLLRVVSKQASFRYTHSTTRQLWFCEDATTSWWAL